MTPPRQPKKNGTFLVGHVGVDSGMIWIGDPCYLWPRKKEEGEPSVTSHIGSWGQMGEQFFASPFPHTHNFDGLGVAVTSGYGDGEYPVYATVEDDIITSVTIRFVEDDLEREEEEMRVCEKCLKTLDEDEIGWINVKGYSHLCDGCYDDLPPGEELS